VADTPSPNPSIVRLITADGKETAGLGVLLSSRHVVTCAHVVNTALGLGQRTQREPESPVLLEFPLLEGQPDPPARLHGTVARWIPPSTDTLGGDDIAGIVLDSDPPDGAVPARLLAEPARPGRPVSVFGYPGPSPRPGSWVPATVRGTVGNSRIQLDSSLDAAQRVQPGFSGSPVHDDATGRVVGILTLAPHGTTPDRDSYAVAADRLRTAWPDVLSGHWQRAAARRRTRESAELTVLHISGPRFTGDKTDAEHPLLSRLHHDLDVLAEHHDLRPDLLVVTGDLTSQGLRSEFDQAVRFLNGLAEAVGIPSRHVAIVPGNHDVNRRACDAYFREAESDERDPVPPFFPKWRHYSKAFNSFYKNTPGYFEFTADEPFTLFEIPDLNAVVAGFNSTIADSHLESDHYGFLGKSQLDSFQSRLAEYQQRGWLRIAAVHHGDPRDLDDLDQMLRNQEDDTRKQDLLTGNPGLANILLHDGLPGTRIRHLPSGIINLATGTSRYQIITIRPDTVTRHVRRYGADEGRWVGDTGVSSSGSDWRNRVQYQLTDVHETFPVTENPNESATASRFSGDSPSARRPDQDDFLERVAEAARVRYPRATVTERPTESYLRVCVPREDGGTEQQLIGVIDGPPTEEAVNAYAGGVHARLASADPSLHSELIYGASIAPASLQRHALRCGIRLKSMVEFQGLLDLRQLTTAQQERLATDQVYPPGLYVEQRYRTVDSNGLSNKIQTGLITQAVSWLGAEHARLVLVLGDFGRGKTSFLRQLTRLLPNQLPSLTPVLVELRSLEKGPTLEDLLGQHLMRQGIEDFSPPKLRYMIDSGRVALLFDGFDELELRVGYETAAEYLQSLIGSVTSGNAKVILTSRTQHFRSTAEVRTALGQQVESRAASRVVILEEFSDKQMTEFLTLLYDGDERRARERFDLFQGIGNLLGLAHNPRMLSFIAKMDSDQLRAALDNSGRVNAAGLYQQIIDSWLTVETRRQHHPHGLPTITKEERFEACTALALRLWTSRDPRIALSDLSEAVMDTLSDLAERGFTSEQAAHTIASGTLLVRSEDGAFSFIHQSILEWFVARAAVSDREILSRGQVSRLMASFFSDLAATDSVANWTDQVLSTPSDSAFARRNAYTLAEEAGKEASQPTGLPGLDPPGLGLRGLDLRGHELSGQDLHNSDLRGTNLRGMRFDEVILDHADLTDADLTGVTMTRGSMRHATLAGSKWHRSAILGTRGLDDVLQSPELDPAAIPGRDPVEAMFVPPGTCDDIDFSPDGTLLAVGQGHTVQLVDAVDGTILRILRGHSQQVTAVAFSPDGSIIATGSRDSTVRLWDVSTGTVRSVITGHGDWVTSVAFSPDPDSQVVATSSRDHTARTWDSITGSPRNTFRGHEGSVNCVAFSPDGVVLVTGSTDATVRTWNVSSATAIRILTGHERAVTTVATSPDGTLLATGSSDGTIRTWDADTGAERSTIAQYPRALQAIAFSSDGALLATSHGTLVETLDPASGTRQGTIGDQPLQVTSLAFSSRDGAQLATSSPDGAYIWNTASGNRRAALTSATASVTAVAFSPDGAQLAVADEAGTAHVWDTHTGNRRAAFANAHSQRVTAVVFSHDQSLMATASRDGTVRVWESATGDEYSRQRRNSPAALAFSQDDAFLSAASVDGAVRTWNVGPQAGVVARAFETADAISFSADGSLLASASSEGICLVHAIPSGNRVAEVAMTTRYSEQILAVALSPDGMLIAIALQDGTVDVWNTRSRERTATFRGHSAQVNTVCFSLSGTTVATGADDLTARTWDPNTGEERAVFEGHFSGVQTVAISADEALIATGSSDGTARLWNADTDQPVATLISLPDGSSATLLPDCGYKLSDRTDDLWWASKLHRFSPGELDPYVENLRRLDFDNPLF